MDELKSLTEEQQSKIKDILSESPKNLVNQFLKEVATDLIFFKDAEEDLSRTDLLKQLELMQTCVQKLVTLIDPKTSKLSRGQLSHLSSKYLFEQRQYNEKNPIGISCLVKRANQLGYTIDEWRSGLIEKKGVRNGTYRQNSFVKVVHRAWMSSVNIEITAYTDNKFWQVFRILGENVGIVTQEPHKTFMKHIN